MSARATTKSVRVVAGSAGGLFLRAPKNFNSRPTKENVREAMFSSLGNLIPNAVVLDLYSGTGSIGIEALSRGATSCIFVEQTRAYAECIRQNLEYCRLKAQVVVDDASRYLHLQQQSPRFDIIFLDPPYAKHVQELSADPICSLLASVLQPEGIIVWEHDPKNHWTAHPELVRTKSARYGSSHLSYLRHAHSESS